MSTTGKQNEGVFGTLRAFWSILISVLYTRLALASTELEEERERLEQLVVLGISAALLFGMAVFFSAFFLVVVFWEERKPVLAVISIVLIVSSVTVGFKVYRLIAQRPKFMAGTLKELQRDLEELRKLQPRAEAETTHG